MLKKAEEMQSACKEFLEAASMSEEDFRLLVEKHGKPIILLLLETLVCGVKNARRDVEFGFVREFIETVRSAERELLANADELVPSERWVSKPFALVQGYRLVKDLLEMDLAYTEPQIRGYMKACQEAKDRKAWKELARLKMFRKSTRHLWNV